MTKRKPKTLADLERKKGSRSINQRILIVCEGKTERIYLTGIKNKFKLGVTKEITIPDDNDPSPISVVSYAENKYYEDRKDNKDNEYDYVFCVIDRDGHQSYQRAVNKIANLNRSITNSQFQLYLSDPCIEYWLLLHHIYTDKPYNSTSRKSRADYAISDLKRYEPNYTKTDSKIITGFISKLDIALQHAERSYLASQTRGDTNPSSNVHELINILLKDKA